MICAFPFMTFVNDFPLIQASCLEFQSFQDLPDSNMLQLEFLTASTISFEINRNKIGSKIEP